MKIKTFKKQQKKSWNHEEKYAIQEEIRFIHSTFGKRHEILVYAYKS